MREHSHSLQDAYLPQRLVDKLMYMFNYIEMARVTGVPMSFLLTRGQSIKVFSQILRKARQKNMLVPNIKARPYYTPHLISQGVMMSQKLNYDSLQREAGASSLDDVSIKKLAAEYLLYCAFGAECILDSRFKLCIVAVHHISICLLSQTNASTPHQKTNMSYYTTVHKAYILSSVELYPHHHRFVAYVL